MSRNRHVHVLKALGWSVLGGLMLRVTYLEYLSWETTGIVSARREGFRLSGGGAVSLLVGYISLSMLAFALAYAEWRKCKLEEKPPSA